MRPISAPRQRVSCVARVAWLPELARILSLLTRMGDRGGGQPQDGQSRQLLPILKRREASSFMCRVMDFRSRFGTMAGPIPRRLGRFRLPPGPCISTRSLPSARRRARAVHSGPWASPTAPSA